MSDEPRQDLPPPPVDEIPAALPIARPILADVILPDDDPMLLRRMRRGQVWIDMGALLLILIAVEMLLGTVIHGLLPEAAGDDPPEAALRPYVLPLLAIRGLTVCAIVPLIVRHRRQSRRSIGLHSSNGWLDLGLGLIAPIVIYGLGIILINSIALFWRDIHGGFEENIDRVKSMFPPVHPLTFVPISILIGVYEELLFRGFIMTRLRRATGSWFLAVIISTTIFTLLHAGDQTNAVLILVALLSLVFSILTIWRRSLIPAIIAHSLWDLGQFLLLHFFMGDQWT